MPYTKAQFNKDMLDRHNWLRSQVSNGCVIGQPPAANMNKLQHSCALEKVATDWAQDMCDNDHFNHNPETGAHFSSAMSTITAQNEVFVIDTNNNPQVGENLYMVSSSGSISAERDTFLNGLNAWFNEHQDYKFANKYCPPDKMCGHYTQMVWADTTHVGCGWALCGSKINMACNYFSAGNYPYHPYIEGEQCSQSGQASSPSPPPGTRGVSCTNGLSDGCIPKEYFKSSGEGTCNVGDQETKALQCGFMDGGTGGQGTGADNNVQGVVGIDCEKGGVANHGDGMVPNATGGIGGGDGLSGAAIAAIVLGVLFGIALLVVVGFCWKDMQSKRAESPQARARGQGAKVKKAGKGKGALKNLSRKDVQQYGA